MSKIGPWALFGAFVLHNVEEAFTMPAFLRDRAAQLTIPFMVAVALVTVAALVVVSSATRANPSDWAPGMVTVLAWVMVVNVLAPHVPAAIVTGGYVPGLVTAVLVSLPVGLVHLRRQHSRTAEQT